MKKTFPNGFENSNDVKFGNLMWNGEGVDDTHPLRNLENEDEKVNQLVTYLTWTKINLYRHIEYILTFEIPWQLNH